MRLKLDVAQNGFYYIDLSDTYNAEPRYNVDHLGFLTLVN